MERILIIGNAGSGKTTFSRKLAQQLNLPLVHLDQIYWCGEWEHLSREEFDSVLQKELENPRWIIDGNFNRTLPLRLKYCDTVFFFDLPTITCLWGITKRVFTNYGHAREDMGGNCKEYFDAQKIPLYRNVLHFNKEHHKHYHRMLSQADKVNVVVFRSRRQANKFLKSL